jgi:hypothetical protein
MFTSTARTVLFVVLAGAFVSAACGEDAGERTADADNNAVGDGGSDAGGADGADIDSDVADQAMPTPDIAADRVLSDLTEPELDILCAARELWWLSLGTDYARFQCLADAVDGGQVGNDPVLTCNRMHSACSSLIDLRDQFPDLEPDPVTVSCMAEMTMRRRERCGDPTVEEYKVCTLANHALQLEVLERRLLTCEEAVDLVSIEPIGLMDCACGREERIGPVPSDDLDWDYVLDAQDECPDSRPDLVVTAYGCDRWQDTDLDGKSDLNDLCIDSEIGVTDVDANGCSATQDVDLDGIPNADDICPDTVPGAALVSEGCSAAQDEDGDGVPNRGDWCPFTPQGSALADGGCAVDQGLPWEDPYLEVLPDGVVPIALGADGDELVTMYYLPSGATSTAADELSYAGTLLLAVPDGGYMQLPASDVTFGSFDAVEGRARHVGGYMPVPLPAVGLFGLGRLGFAGGCAVGIGRADAPELVELEAPLEQGRTYIYADCDASFGLSVGALSIYNDTTNVLVVVDPGDPSIFVRADVDNLGPLKRLRDVSFGVSNGGRLSFVPETIWGVPDGLGNAFGAHVVVGGTAPIDLPNVPPQLVELSVEGEVFVDFDPLGSGLPSFESPDVRVGANGALQVESSFFGGLRIRADLADASMTAQTSATTTTVWASGRMEPNDLGLPLSVPISQPNQVLMAIFLSSHVEESFLQAEGTFVFHGSEINLPLIPNMVDFEVEGRAEIDATGILLRGTVRGELHEWVDASSPVTVEAWVAWSLREFHVSMTGSLVFFDEFSVGDLYFGNDDIRVGGESFSFSPF